MDKSTDEQVALERSAADFRIIARAMLRDRKLSLPVLSRILREESENASHARMAADKNPTYSTLCSQRGAKLPSQNNEGERNMSMDDELSEGDVDGSARSNAAANGRVSANPEMEGGSVYKLSDAVLAPEQPVAEGAPKIARFGQFTIPGNRAR